MYQLKRCMYLFHIIRASHTYTTHSPRTQKVAIFASALSFAGCASACVTQCSYDERTGPTICMRCVRRDFCACTKMCAELDTWMNTPERRQTCAERVGQTPGTRGAHAGYLLYVVRFSSSAHRAHTQRASDACPALHARAIRSAR